MLGCWLRSSMGKSRFCGPGRGRGHRGGACCGRGHTSSRIPQTLRVTPGPPHSVREACGRGLHREARSLCSPDSWAHRWLSCENFCPLGHMVQPWCRPAGPCLAFITLWGPDPCGRLRRGHQRKGGVPASSLSPLPFHAYPLLTWFLCLSLSPQVPGSHGDRQVVSRKVASDSALAGARPLGPGTPRNCSQIRRGGEVSSPQAASGQSDLKKARDKTKQNTQNQTVTLATHDY